MGGILPGEDPAAADCLTLRRAQLAATANNTPDADAAPIPSAPAPLVTRVRCCGEPQAKSMYVLDYEK